MVSRTYTNYVLSAGHVVDYYLREKNNAGFQGDTKTDGLSGFRG